MSGPFPSDPGPASWGAGGIENYPGAGPTGFPPRSDAPSYRDALPPPVAYPPSRGRRLKLAAALAALVVVLGGAAGLAVWRHDSHPTQTAAVTTTAAKTAIQDYLTALSRGDDATIARHASCGFFDALTDKKSDLALADLASDAFRHQFGSAQVRSIDKIVTGSPTQAQVLFTMDVTPAATRSGPRDLQAVAQLLVQGDDVLVCSYLPRVAQY